MNTGELRDNAEGVEFFTTENEDIKASVAERLNRSIKQKIWKFFTKNNTLRFIETLPRLVKSYNHAFHRSIKRSPIDVTKKNQEDVWETLYNTDKNASNTRQRFELGDNVRISKARKTFGKGYLPSWTQELFTISKVNTTRPITFIIKDYHGDVLKGSFHPEELQKVGDTQIYRIESILRRRGNKYLVKWYGYDASFNSWIPKSALKLFKG